MSPRGGEAAPRGAPGLELFLTVLVKSMPMRSHLAVGLLAAACVSTIPIVPISRLLAAAQPGDGRGGVAPAASLLVVDRATRFIYFVDLGAALAGSLVFSKVPLVDEAGNPVSFGPLGVAHIENSIYVSFEDRTIRHYNWSEFDETLQPIRSAALPRRAVSLELTPPRIYYTTGEDSNVYALGEADLAPTPLYQEFDYYPFSRGSSLPQVNYRLTGVSSQFYYTFSPFLAGFEVLSTSLKSLSRVSTLGLRRDEIYSGGEWSFEFEAPVPVPSPEALDSFSGNADSWYQDSPLHAEAARAIHFVRSGKTVTVLREFPAFRRHVYTRFANGSLVSGLENFWYTGWIFAERYQGAAGCEGVMGNVESGSILSLHPGAQRSMVYPIHAALGLFPTFEQASEITLRLGSERKRLDANTLSQAAFWSGGFRLPPSLRFEFADVQPKGETDCAHSALGLWPSVISDERDALWLNDLRYVIHQQFALPGDMVSPADISVGHSVATAAPQGDLRVVSVEPVQVVWNPPALVLGTSTVFRVRFESTLARPVDTVVEMSFRGFDGGATVLRETVTVTAGARNEFILPEQSARWVVPTSKDIEYSFTIDAFNDVRETDETNNSSGPLGYRVVNTRNLEVLLVPVRTSQPFAGEPAQGPSAELMRHVQSLSHEFLLSRYPIADNGHLGITTGREELQLRIGSELVVDPPTTTAALFARLTALAFSPATLFGGRSRLYDRVVGILPTASWLETIAGRHNVAGVADGCSGVAALMELTPIDSVASGVAHEIGHTCGLSDDYPAGGGLAPTFCPGNGRFENALADGYHVRRALNIRNAFTFMNSRRSDFFNWVDNMDFDILLRCLLDVDPEVLFVQGTLRREAGGITAELGKAFYRIPEGYADLVEGSSGAYSIVLLDGAGGVLGRFSFDAGFRPLDAADDDEGNEAAFAFRVPWAAGTARIELRDDETEAVLASRQVSASAPTVAVTVPAGGEVLSRDASPFTLSWEAADADGDGLSFSVHLSSDGGETWIPLAAGLDESSYSWDFSTLPGGTSYMVGVIASDGVNVGGDRSERTFTVASFRVEIPEPERTVVMGEKARFAVNVQSYGGFAGEVMLNAESSLPAEAFLWDPGPAAVVPAAGFAEVTLEVDAGVATPGGHVFRVAGAADGVEHAADAGLVVLPRDEPPPEIEAVEPDTGRPGDRVAIRGTGFEEGLQVFFDSVPSDEVSFGDPADPGRVEATVPELAPGAYLIRVRSARRSESNGVAFGIVAPPPAALFRRGDANDDGEIDISDTVRVLLRLFGGNAGLLCEDAADSNDDGTIDISDAAYILESLFLGGTLPPAPGPSDCGPDPTADTLSDCEAACRG